MNEVNRIIHPKGLLMYDSAFYGRRENVTILDWEGIVGLAQSAIFSRSRLREIVADK